ncbi:epoxyqueuosine reductase [Natranaerovirga hydrolytica]|uniref:Epoxyqueuosine reductase n=1 Tax=Natranaerovirga hydrolytica TaxID=680378 RepID=A0A4R1N061_9FIRM|nr:tRNA epoxyqueuosine(34) reductase QueG [Natranaerovirga hydrolytica]TCK98270.1 epoxyqueuosine reductase [Natranaerovirga hydrolytica]
MAIKDEIIQYSQGIHIDTIGFCDAKPFLEYKKILEERRKRGYYIPFEEQDIQKRIDPSQSLPNAKTFIVIGESYQYNAKKHKTEILKGHIAISAIGKDYHKVVMEKLDLLEKYILSLTQCQIKKFVDISPLPDRQIAKRAGLGFVGKNNMLIHPDFGSRFNIGYLLTDLEIQPDVTNDFMGCGGCNRCEIACPTKAIIGDYSMNPNRCIAYLTQHKGDIEDELKEKMGKQIYGCDICQQVCPYNQSLPNNKTIEPLLDHEMSIEKLLNLSNKAFKDLFGPTSAAWRGKKTIQRNAVIALGNMKEDRSIELLEMMSKDLRKEIKQEVIWALGKKKNEKARCILKEMLDVEQDEALTEAIKTILNESLMK